MKEIKIQANDGLELSCILASTEAPKAIIQIIHGMCEHKERYIPLMEILNQNGYAAIASDNRGHGSSVNEQYVLGNTGTPEDLVSDQYIITKYIKDKFKNIPVVIFSHSMGTLISRAYIMKHDIELKGLILSGTVCCNSMAGLAVFLSKVKCIGNGENKSSSLLYAFSNGFSFKDDISWLSYNENNRIEYAKDPLCGFRFKNNGYLTLFKLVALLTKNKEYLCQNNSLPILSLSGCDDRTTGGTKGLKGVVKALNKASYNNVSFIEYQNMKHEILNEDNKEIVYNDIIKYLEGIK